MKRNVGRVASVAVGTVSAFLLSAQPARQASALDRQAAQSTPGRLADPNSDWVLGINPRMKQVAGAIDLIRDTPPALWAKVLPALNGVQMRAQIIEKDPSVGDAWRSNPVVAEEVRTYAGLSSADGLQVFLDAAFSPADSSSDISSIPISVVWRTPDGRTLVLRQPGIVRTAASAAAHGPNALGWLAAFGVALLGMATAAASWISARSSTAPLRLLVEAASAFDGNGPSLPSQPEGSADVQRLVEAVRRMQGRVTMLLQERSFLVGAISHDIKTYLTRLRLRAEVMTDAQGQARMVADLDAMTDLIETALAFARGTTVSRRRSLVDLADLVAIEAAERLVVGQEVGISYPETADAIVLGDPMALRRVLSNLIDNAFKFGRGRVDITVDPKADSCEVLVDDDGPGVSDLERTAIFSPFYRIEGSRSPRTGGSGLGLAIARQIVEAHGGSIAVEAGPLGGAQFLVILPKRETPSSPPT